MADRANRSAPPVNSGTASSLKEARGPLVNSRKFADDAVAVFQCERFFYCKAVADGTECFDASYSISCNKVCEITAIRALVRTEPDGESRKILCDRAKKTVESLQGSIPPQLQLRVETARGN